MAIRRPTIQVAESATNINTGRDEHFVRLVGGNGEIVMVSEMYTSKGNAVKSAQRIKRWLPIAKLDLGGPFKAADHPNAETPPERILVVGGDQAQVNKWVDRNRLALMGAATHNGGVVIRTLTRPDAMRGQQAHYVFEVGTVTEDMDENAHLAARLGEHPRVIKLFPGEDLAPMWRQIR